MKAVRRAEADASPPQACVCMVRCWCNQEEQGTDKKYAAAPPVNGPHVTRQRKRAYLDVQGIQRALVLLHTFPTVLCLIDLGLHTTAAAAA